MARGSKSRVAVLKVLPVFRPAVGQEEIDAVAKVIRSGWIGLGPKTEEFEKRVSKLFGKKLIVTYHCDLSFWKGFLNLSYHILFPLLPQ